MPPYVLLAFVLGYFVLLLAVAWYTSRNATNDSFYIGNRSSNWKLVAFGMIGTSLSGVTFVSVPGSVGHRASAEALPNAMGYFQVVIGYFLGYLVVAFVLLPLYYKLNLTSIYKYLQQRFGQWAYKTGASFFILSRTVGATARLYLVINILHIFILSNLGIPFWVSTAVVLLMILLYTIEGGVKTIVYTDTLQTTLMVLGLIICVGFILVKMDFSPGEAIRNLSQNGLTKMINSDPLSPGFFVKQILGGMFITIAMTGLDQEMMQKNISVRTLGDSQKNMLSFSVILVLVNLLFLFLGGLLYLYAYHLGAGFSQGPDGNWGFYQQQLNITGDSLFPSLALGFISNVPPVISVIFIIALISALFPSADGALTALTSSFCLDILGLMEKQKLSEAQKKRIRLTVHLSLTVIFFLCILIFQYINSRSIIDKILNLAGYTYGPLLGLFAFGIFSKRTLPNTAWIALVCILSPLLCYLLQTNSAKWFGGYVIGIEILILNGLLTFAGLYLISKKEPNSSH